MHSNIIATTLASVSIGPDVTFENLTMIPLIADPSRLPSTPRLDYMTLDEALGEGLAEVTEISDHGSVPELRFLNRGGRPVLVIDGEELVGAKQNRVVNLTILATARATLSIPVSCVEAGRWRARSRTFSAAPRTQFASGRAKRVAQVTESLRVRGQRASDQAEIWADIADKSERLHASSRTSAMEAIFTEHSRSLESFVAACQPIDRQVGAIFIVNDAVASLDLFDEPATFRKLLPKIVRSVAIDAIDRRTQDLFEAGPAPRSRHASPASEGEHRLSQILASQFLAVIAESDQHSAAAIGLGEDIRLSAPHIAGAALAVGGHVVHLASFAL